MNNNKNGLIHIAQKLGYEGDSNTEAEAWINAHNKGMDLSKEARLQRASEMGFNTETIYYHGTGSDFDRFNKSTIGKNYTHSKDSGFFFTEKKSSAKNYAYLHSNNQEGRVISAFLRFDNPYILETNSDYYTPADRFDISSFDIMHDVRLEKFDSVLIKGTRNDNLCVVLEPNQILSIHAAFDPETEDYKEDINLKKSKKMKINR